MMAPDKREKLLAAKSVIIEELKEVFQSDETDEKTLEQMRALYVVYWYLEDKLSKT